MDRSPNALDSTGSEGAHKLYDVDIPKKGVGLQHRTPPFLWRKTASDELSPCSRLFRTFPPLLPRAFLPWRFSIFVPSLAVRPGSPSPVSGDQDRRTGSNPAGAGAPRCPGEGLQGSALGKMEKEARAMDPFAVSLPHVMSMES